MVHDTEPAGPENLAEAVVYTSVNGKTQNTTDATRGQPLAARVLARKDELEDALADCGVHQVQRRRAIETALTAVYALITGDLAHPPDIIARALNAWLERNKHLA